MCCGKKMLGYVGVKGVKTQTLLDEIATAHKANYDNRELGVVGNVG